MARFVQGDGIEVVVAGAVDAEVVLAVEHHVASPGAAGEVERRGVGEMRIRRLRRHGDADIAKTRIALRRAAGAQRLSAIGYDADVDVGVDGPGLEGPQNLGFPVRRGGAAVQGLQEVARIAANACSIRNEAQCQVAGIGPGDAPLRRGEPVFQTLQEKLA